VVLRRAGSLAGLFSFSLSSLPSLPPRRRRRFAAEEIFLALGREKLALGAASEALGGVGSLGSGLGRIGRALGERQSRSQGVGWRWMVRRGVGCRGGDEVRYGPASVIFPDIPRASLRSDGSV